MFALFKTKSSKSGRFDLSFWLFSTSFGVNFTLKSWNFVLSTTSLYSINWTQHLITQWYWDMSDVRRSELLQTLETNIDNSLITNIHLIVNEKSVREELAQLNSVLTRSSQKIVWVTTQNTDDRLLASDAFKYASKYLKGHIVLLANLDISFDESLTMLLSQDCDLSRYKAYSLSRHEKPENEHLSIGIQCGPKCMGSADTAAFIPPLPKSLIERTHLHLGSWGYRE